jgi:uroporphyrin-III C-methyltransferase/precorrin-2 dehydrogenase/sirohydrochlorin ferrochelatase
MGLQGIGALCEGLIAHGRAPATPAAIVEQATRPGQRVLVATLADLAVRVEQAGLRAPTLVIIGEVVALHGPLAAALRHPLNPCREESP